MKRIFFIIPIVFFVLPLAARAQELSLGDFSVQDLQRVFGSPVNFHVKDKTVTADKNTLLGFIKIRPALMVSPDYNSEIENIYYLPTDSPGVKVYFRFMGRERNLYHTRISNNLAVNEDSLKDYLGKIKDDTRVAPQDAKFAFADGKVNAFSVSSNGYEVLVDESLSTTVNDLKNNPYAKDVTLPTTVLTPEISSVDTGKYGIRELIGTGSSNFRGSPKNRIHNIGVGAKRFNGVLIKPGEEFSFIKTLGPVDASTGYLPELVIKTDKTIPEYGGGMCQVSTTMFRAALNSGLKITARTNHAYPVQYYSPQGLDATVYIPRPDLMFVNDTPAYILVQTRIEGTQLAFDFYGTSDGRETKIVGPFVTERGEGGAMKTIVAQEVYGKDGNLVRKSEFKSKYDSPSKYPHPGEEIITEKPKDWSSKEWKAYKKAHGM